MTQQGAERAVPVTRHLMAPKAERDNEVSPKELDGGQALATVDFPLPPCPTAPFQAEPCCRQLVPTARSALASGDLFFPDYPSPG